MRLRAANNNFSVEGAIINEFLEELLQWLVDA